MANRFKVYKAHLYNEEQFADTPTRYLECEALDNCGNKRVNIPSTLLNMWHDVNRQLLCVQYRNKEGQKEIARIPMQHVRKIYDDTKGFPDPEKKSK